MSKTVISICADDIGQDPAINEGCLELFHLNRLNAVSALAEAPFITSQINEWNLARKKGLQIGLHFNLTLNLLESNSSKSLGTWIALSHLRQINKDEIRRAFINQLDAFTNHFGHLPDFIDGHQHVHQFPVIRDVLLNEIQNRFSTEESFWVRNTQPPQNSSLPDALKCKTLVWLGGKDLRTKLIEADIRTNQGFLGVYGFNALTVENYRKLMRQWLKAATNKSLLMCHPANKPVQNDAIGKQRPIEFEYLKSDLFKTDLDEFDIAIDLNN